MDFNEISYTELS